jgi:NADPH:quinone reductase-like Zn-dependent oxidoreductase
MSARRSTRPPREPIERHEGRVQGHPDGRWADQAALHGRLNRMRDLNVPAVSVRRAAPDDEGRAERATTRQTMRAVVQDAYGPADVLRLREIEKPEIGPDDVLVRVRAAGLHIGDWHLMTGRPYLMRVLGFGFRAPKDRVRGTDVAGTVEATGKNVTRFRVGDDVFGTGHGSFAEFSCAQEATLAAKPAALTFEQAAAVPTSACTALQALRASGGVQPGQQVLVVGASGGVGMFAVQIAKSFGAEVTGVCSTSKVDVVRALGADHVVDYTQEDFTRSGRRYDVILDMGGNRPLARLRRALTARATLVLVGGEGGDRWTGGMARSVGALLVSPFVSQNLRMVSAKATAADLGVLRELLVAGTITPVVERTYPLGGVPDAIRHLKAGKARGKLVITI